MFNFKRDGTHVVAEVEAKADQDKRWFVFRWNCNDQVYAELLTKSFKENLFDKMKKVRREAYESGWKDAKAKNAKQDWFGGYL